MREREKHRAAFERYVAMGQSRSLTRLAAELGASESAVKKWSRELDWAGRLAERQRRIADAVSAQSTEQEVEERVTQKKLVRLALVDIARKMIAGQIRPTFGDMDRMIRLERDLDEDGRTEGAMQFVVVREEVPRSLDAGELDDVEPAPPGSSEKGDEGEPSKP